MHPASTTRSAPGYAARSQSSSRPGHAHAGDGPPFAGPGLQCVPIVIEPGSRIYIFTLAAHWVRP